MKIEKESNVLFKITHDNGNSCIGGLEDMIHILCTQFKYPLSNLIEELLDIQKKEAKKEFDKMIL